jgi:hypothetical protein
MDELNELQERYRAKFGEILPLFMVPDSSIEGIRKLIDECIESGKPYEPEDNGPDILY